VSELSKTRRVSERTYRRVHSFLGDSLMVELVGILGYYGLVAMMLDVFNVPLPPDAPVPFAEK
jgi:4-carboxymuconolactone decarboxylase